MDTNITNLLSQMESASTPGKAEALAVKAERQWDALDKRTFEDTLALSIVLGAAAVVVTAAYVATMNPVPATIGDVHLRSATKTEGTGTWHGRSRAAVQRCRDAYLYVPRNARQQPVLTLWEAAVLAGDESAGNAGNSAHAIAWFAKEGRAAAAAAAGKTPSTPRASGALDYKPVTVKPADRVSLSEQLHKATSPDVKLVPAAPLTVEDLYGMSDADLVALMSLIEGERRRRAAFKAGRDGFKSVPAWHNVTELSSKAQSSKRTRKSAAKTA